MKIKTVFFIGIGIGIMSIGISIFGILFNSSHYKISYLKFFNPIYAYEETDVSNSAIIKGKVIYSGSESLDNKKKLITKDKEVCGDGYKIDEVYLINKNREVQNVVVYIDSINRGKKIHKGEFILKQERCEFNPKVFAVPTGTRLTILNQDTVTHEANGNFNFATIFQFSQHKKGMKDSIELKQSGVVSITCNIHGWMKSFAIVLDHPYYSTTDKNGNFIIQDLPAGTYTIKIWHEKLKAEEISLTLNKNETKEIQIKVQ